MRQTPGNEINRDLESCPCRVHSWSSHAFPRKRSVFPFTFFSLSKSSSPFPLPIHRSQQQVINSFLSPHRPPLSPLRIILPSDLASFQLTAINPPLKKNRSAYMHRPPLELHPKFAGAVPVTLDLRRERHDGLLPLRTYSLDMFSFSEYVIPYYATRIETARHPSTLSG